MPLNPFKFFHFHALFYQIWAFSKFFVIWHFNPWFNLIHLIHYLDVLTVLNYGMTWYGPPPHLFGGGDTGKWPPPGAENLEKVGGPPYCGGTSIDRVIVGGWSLNTVKLLNFQQFGLLNSKNFGAARHFLSGSDNFICSPESAVQKHCRNESCLRGNDYFLWRELDSLLHDSAVLVGGPQLSRYVGGP